MTEFYLLFTLSQQNSIIIKKINIFDANYRAMSECLMAKAMNCFFFTSNSVTVLLERGY